MIKLKPLPYHQFQTKQYHTPYFAIKLNCKKLSKESFILARIGVFPASAHCPFTFTPQIVGVGRGKVSTPKYSCIASSHVQSQVLAPNQPGCSIQSSQRYSTG